MSERILVCGSRDWSGAWEDIAEHFPESGDVTIIHGACSRKKSIVSFGKTFHNVEVSVDMLADYIARNLGFNVEVYPADWKRGNMAGPQRNDRMLRNGKPDRGLAFGALWKRELSRIQGVTWRWKHRGTGDMVSKMLAFGVPVRWVPAPGEPARDITLMPPPPVA